MKRTRLLIIAQTVLCLLSGMRLDAQERLDYWRDGETYVQDQASMIFDEACRVLDKYPPGATVCSERKLALLSLDAMLHDTRLDNGAAFRSYMERMADTVITGLRDDKPAEGETRFYRFYNHGFIIQTPSVTVGIDLVRGGTAGGPFIADSSMRGIVDLCDVLLVTHAHGDHMDISVIDMFCGQGKDVIVPEGIPMNNAQQLRVLRGGVGPVSDRIAIPGKGASLNVVAYPGYQGDVLNNVYLITLPGGETVMHTGDQDYSDDLVKAIGGAKVDVLLVHCWMMPMRKFISAVGPSLVICGHENEMGHSIDHREAYWLTFRRMSGVEVPYIVMAWGESYTL